MTAETKHRELIAFLTNQISQLTSFADMFDFYLLNRSVLKDWTFIVSTKEPNNMDLYDGLEKISGIRERLFTPFSNGRVSIINDRILQRCLSNDDSRARTFRCVSFDTQTVSYIERYYKKGTVSYEGFETVIQLLKKRKALTVAEQELLLDYLRNTPQYRHWYPIFAVMLGTGLRVGEATGLRWCDIDLDEGLIDVNHTLVYYSHGPQKGCSFNVNTPKTKAGERVVPMLGFVKEAFLGERENQKETGISCKASVDGYTDFIFVNRYGDTQHLGTLNKAIRRIIRDCNDAQFEKSENPEVLLPHFSCHTLRHTFTTRMCEAGVNIKVIQDALGHADVSTTLGIYADVTKDLRKDEFAGLDAYFQKGKLAASNSEASVSQ